MTFADAADKLHIKTEEVIQLLKETEFLKQDGTPYVKYINEGYFTKTHFLITKQKEKEVISILKQNVEKKRNAEIAKRKKALASYLSVEPSSIYWDGDDEVPFKNSLFYHGYDAIYEVLSASEVKEMCFDNIDEYDIRKFAARLTIEQIIDFLDTKKKLTSFLEDFKLYYQLKYDEMYKTSSQNTFIREINRYEKEAPKKAWCIISEKLEELDKKRFNEDYFYDLLVDYLKGDPDSIQERFVELLYPRPRIEGDPSPVWKNFAEYTISIVGEQEGLSAFSYFHKYKKVGRKPNIYFIRQLKEEETRRIPVPHMEKKCSGCAWYFENQDDERDCCGFDNEERDVPLDNEECPFKESSSKVKNKSKLYNQTFIGLNKPLDPDEPDFEPSDDEEIDLLRTHGLRSVEEHLTRLNRKNLDAYEIKEKIVELQEWQSVFLEGDDDSPESNAKGFDSYNELEALRRALESNEDYQNQQAFERDNEEWCEEWNEDNDD